MPQYIEVPMSVLFYYPALLAFLSLSPMRYIVYPYIYSCLKNICVYVYSSIKSFFNFFKEEEEIAEFINITEKKPRKRKNNKYKSRLGKTVVKVHVNDKLKHRKEIELPPAAYRNSTIISGPIFDILQQEGILINNNNNDLSQMSTETSDSSSSSSSHLQSSFAFSNDLKTKIEELANMCINDTNRDKHEGFRIHMKLHVEDENVREAEGELKEGIASLYDQSTYAWEKLWGDHLHHGYYDGQQNDHQQAQVDMIENTLKFMGLVSNEGRNAVRITNSEQIPVATTERKEKKGRKKNNNNSNNNNNVNENDNEEIKIEKVLDVGCGLGGSSRYLHNKFGCETLGITLSPYQKMRAEVLSKEQGVSDKTKFMICDALKMPFPKNSFDLIWSMESAEHFPRKQHAIKDFIKVCKPGGRICIVTWCHRNLANNERSLSDSEQNILDKLCEYFYLSEWWSLNDYVKCFRENGLEDIKYDDWTPYVKPFWSQVLLSACSLRGIYYLLQSGFKTFRALWASLYMIRGYNNGVIKFVIITAKKKKN